MKLVIIESGSKQNAALIIKGGKSLLVDCGISMKRLKTALDFEGLSTQNVVAALITHSHSDHVKGMDSVKKQTGIPFYSCADVEGCEKLDSYTEIDGFEITGFCLSHDVDCCGYKISADGKTVCFVTDTGVVTDEALNAMTGISTVVLESNHDEEMLRYGNYPYPLKQRILSDNGHLSNKTCAKTLAYLASKGLERAVLAHLSENNNTPLTARNCAKCELEKYGFDNVEVLDAKPMLEIEI